MKPYEPFLTHEVRNALIQHMYDEAPNECIGLIVKDRDRYVYQREVNVHENPIEMSQLSSASRNRLMLDADVVAYCHSHPEGPVEPSKQDMLTQMHVGKPSVIAAVNKPTGIVAVYSFGDHLLDAPLHERTFLHGVFDCMEAIRSFDWQMWGRKIKPCPRHNGWWEYENRHLPYEDRNLYMDNFAGEGYVSFEPDLKNFKSRWHPKMGDMVLMKLDAQVVNHCAVYVGHNKVFHHRLGKLSGESPLGYCLDRHYVQGWLRHKDQL